MSALERTGSSASLPVRAVPGSKSRESGTITPESQIFQQTIGAVSPRKAARKPFRATRIARAHSDEPEESKTTSNTNSSLKSYENLPSYLGATASSRGKKIRGMRSQEPDSPPASAVFTRSTMKSRVKVPSISLEETGADESPKEVGSSGNPKRSGNALCLKKKRSLLRSKSVTVPKSSKKKPTKKSLRIPILTSITLSMRRSASKKNLEKAPVAPLDDDVQRTLERMVAERRKGSPPVSQSLLGERNPRSVSFLVDDEKERGPLLSALDFEQNSSVRAHVARGQYPDQVPALMRSAVLRNDDPSIFLDPPEMECSQEEFLRPTIGSDTLNAITLNLFFREASSSELQDCPARKIIHSHGVPIEIDPLYASAKEILNFPFKAGDIEKVKRMNFYRCQISDVQAAALIKRFINVEEVVFSICPELTDGSIAYFASLKKLKSLYVRFCDKIEGKGFLYLPIERFEEFGFSTNRAIEPQILKRLAASPQLKRVEFNHCPKFTLELLHYFQEAVTKHLLTIHLKGCPAIKNSHVTEINQRRKETPILVHLGPPNESEQFQVGLQDHLEVPPEIPEAGDILSMALLERIFPNRNLGTLPEQALLEAFDFSQEIVDFKGFRGLSLSGTIPNDTLSALLRRFPELEEIRLFDCREFNSNGVVSLRSSIHIKKLILGGCPSVTPRGLEKMFSDTLNSRAWLELTELHLVGMPLTDDALRFISTLENLRRITLSGCDQFTYKGLRHILGGSPSLEYLKISHCPSIDCFAIEEFRQVRSQVFIDADPGFDPFVAKLADEEAQVMEKSSHNSQNFLFHREVTLYKGRDQVKEQGSLGVSKFYRDHLAMIGLEATVSGEYDQTQWTKCDNILQSYKNIFRTAWSLRFELIRVGFFTDQDEERAPRNVEELLHYIKPQINGVNPYVRKVKILDFEALRTTAIPLFILEQNEWSQLRDLRLNGTEIRDLPPQFKARSPMLRKIVHSNERLELLEAPSSPRTKHLAPPVEMGVFPASSSSKAPEKNSVGAFFKKMWGRAGKKGGDT